MAHLLYFVKTSPNRELLGLRILWAGLVHKQLVSVPFCGCSSIFRTGPGNPPSPAVRPFPFWPVGFQAGMTLAKSFQSF